MHNNNYRQIDCFSINMKYWKFLGIYPGNHMSHFYKTYSNIIISCSILLFVFLTMINFYFLPRKMDLFIEETIFFFTELSVMFKILTFCFMKKQIMCLFDILESDIFRQTNKEGLVIIKDKKKFIVRFWKLVAAVSYTSHLTHIFSPLLAHVFLGVDLVLPVCTYSFLSESFIRTFIYPLYFYQMFGMHCCMLTNLNIDTFILGLLVLAIGQLEILDNRLRSFGTPTSSIITRANKDQNIEAESIQKFNQCVIHFNEVAKYCKMVENVFGVSLFVQFSVSSCIICVCLFRLTLPATGDYYVFLMPYLIVMIMQILVPCWFGMRVIDKSSHLSVAVYSCNWTPRSRQFKSSLRLFVERMSQPLTIVGWKMFPLSLATFTSIMNSAYSFFTLLRHMQTRQ